MEKYNDFLERTGYQKPEYDVDNTYFRPDGRVYEKVREDNQFKDFYGDTVVFDLDTETKKKVFGIIRQLYSAVPECFSEKINENTIHMTLHDLSAADKLDSVAAEVFDNEIKLANVLKENPVKPQTIKMRTNYVINMIHTSLVLALYPADENEWNKLQNLYDLIDKVRVCPYPYLTPHITLAYYNYNGFDVNSVYRLKEIVKELNKQSFEITLNTEKLVYQKFTSMNDYISIFNLI